VLPMCPVCGVTCVPGLYPLPRPKPACQARTSGTLGVVFPRAFLELQLTFAEHVSSSLGIPLQQALLEYTNLYVRLGLGRDLEPTQPAWKAYVAGYLRASDRLEWTYQCYLENAEQNTTPVLRATFGCFSYAILDGGAAKLHFRNTEAATSPLASAAAAQRRAELTALFAHLRETEPGGTQVLGSSWLYNLEAYRRLFPQAYTGTAVATPLRYHSMSLWGQFVDHRLELKTQLAQRFLAAVGNCLAPAHLARCFPFPVLSVGAPAYVLHRHFS
jgi:hypothetical protein